MRTLITLFFISLIILFSCNKEDEEKLQLPRPVKYINGVLEGHTTLYEDTIYLMTDRVWVPDGSVLTIEPGTVIKASNDTKVSLVIERGAKIYADGTKEKPIVFTSAQEPGKRTWADWGSIIIAGKAPTNNSYSEVPGGLRILYGGNDPTDNSGIFRYVRIEYAGLPEAGDWSWGLVMAGVGSGTTIEYVQVNSSLDVGFQWYGGTVNCKYLVANNNTFANDFYMYDGYSGMVQFALIVKESPLDSYNYCRGVFISNASWGTPISSYTSPHVSNLTYIGSHSRLEQNKNSGDMGCEISRFSGGSVINSVLVSTHRGTLILSSEFDTISFQNPQEYPFFLFQNNVIAEGMQAHYPSYGGDFSISSRGGFEGVSQQLNDKFYSHNIISNFGEMSIGPFTDAINSTAKLMPTSKSILFSPSVFPSGVPPGFFVQVNFIGAFGTEDWTEGWVNWDPQQTVYE